jgi:hypothetical protein
MKLKQAVLQVMDRDLLKRAVDALGIEDVDRRDRADMAAQVSRKHRATPKFLLGYLLEAQVKEVCELVGVPSVGRREALIEMLLAGDAEPSSHSAAINDHTRASVMPNGDTGEWVDDYAENTDEMQIDEYTAVRQLVE